MPEKISDPIPVQIATLVIIHAGNARKFVNQALIHANNYEFDDAKEKLEKARKEVASAHHTQTELIHAEARGESTQNSLLLTHAQDTLMIAMSEIQMAKHLLKIYDKLFKLTERKNKTDKDKILT